MAVMAAWAMGVAMAYFLIRGRPRFGQLYVEKQIFTG
jgi:hypothetical protein